MPKLIGKILIDVIPKQHSWKIKLFNYWETIIGNMKDKVRIEKITKNSLTLGVTHSTWAQELFFLTPILKQKINVILQEEKIKNINFKTIKQNPKKFRKKSCAKKIANSIEHSLTIIEHGQLKKIDNKELAIALEQFYIRCKKIENLKTKNLKRNRRGRKC